MDMDQERDGIAAGPVLTLYQPSVGDLRDQLDLVTRKLWAAGQTVMELRKEVVTLSSILADLWPEGGPKAAPSGISPTRVYAP
jgi:hypothetical protein